MYRFQGSRPSQLTCRRWILDANGCDDPRCPYLHSVTSRLSPPCAYACWAYNNGGCSKTQDECMYTHLRLDMPLNLSRRYPHLGSQDLSIALAAADAGFDCTNWVKLQRLLDAVRRAASSNGRRFDHRSSHYNRAYRPKPPSSIYPDRWRPDDVRPRRGVAEAYQQADRIPSVPAFGKSAGEILRGIDPNLNSQTSHHAATLPPESQIQSQNTSKRTASGANAVEVRPIKRVKSELVPQTETAQTSATVVDLTQDEGKDTPHNQDEPYTRYNLRSKRTTNNHRKPRSRPNRRTATKSVVQNDTSSIIARCADKLRSALHGIGTDRESLRQRWEVDDDLKFQTVTDQLADLNDRFAEAESALQAAVEVVEKKLLARERK